MQKNLSNVRGFKSWGSHVGIKSKRRDLALIVSENQSNAAAVFTKNKVFAEPVRLSKKHIKDGKAQVFVVNSGNANACTGSSGYEGAVAMAETCSQLLNVPVEDVIVGSTGIIGEPFPTDKVTQGIKEAIPKLSDRQVSGSLAANAILTTDTFAKEGFVDFKINTKQINMAGIAKGSGMIHPNMGTMLGFIICDVAISSELLDKALKEATNKTFNMINVDGDTSTNDMVAIMCNGAAGNKEIIEENTNYNIFYEHLEELCMYLAKLIVSDGEGATKFIEYRVSGAKSDKEARQVVKTISDSKLVQTALFGQDPNWGRIVAAAGRSGAHVKLEKINLKVCGEKLLEMGQPTQPNRKTLRLKMKESEIVVDLNLNLGKGTSVGWGTDISYEYVRINAEYTT